MITERSCGRRSYVEKGLLTLGLIGHLLASASGVSFAQQAGWNETVEAA